MSTAIHLKKIVTSVPVMVQAYGGQPVKLFAVATGSGVVEVASDNGAASVGFPPEHVFVYDERLFARLKTAHDGGHSQKLNKLWGEAKRFSPD